jgi:predicted nucleic acid-binding protein
MSLVIDASAVVSLVLAMPGAEIFSSPLDQADLVLAPDLFTAEVCNAFWKYRKADLLSLDRCESALDHALSLPDQLVSSSDLYKEAFALAVRHLHPVYDALYLVLARRNNSIILTMDRRLAALARKLEIAIVAPT